MGTILDYSEYENVFIVGNFGQTIEGLVDVIANKTNQKNKLFDGGPQNKEGKPTRYFRTTPKTRNVVIIKSAISVNDIDSLKKELNQFEEFLTKTSTTIIALRTITDNPNLFKEVTEVTSNFILIPDYTLIKTKIGNILCVGGGLTVNRYWTKTGKEQTFLQQYFGEAEIPTPLDESKLGILLKTGVDVVITNISPSFLICSVTKKLGIWQHYDKELKNDAIKCYSVIDDIYHQLFKLDILPKIWVSDVIDSRPFNGVIFTGLDETTLDLTHLLAINDQDYYKPTKGHSLQEAVENLAFLDIPNRGRIEPVGENDAVQNEFVDYDDRPAF